MEQIFEEYNTDLENQQGTQESIREHVRNLQNFARIVTFNRNKLHTVLDKGVDDNEAVVNPAWIEFVQSTLPAGDSPFASRPELIRFAEHSLARLQELQPTWAALESAIAAAGNVEQFRDMWRFTLSEIMASVAVFVYVARGTLVSRAQQDALIGVPPSLRTPLEDYLHSIVALPQELVRLAINSVRAGLPHVPAAASAFVNDLSSGFRLLNMRNDSLRKKYDAIKYSVNRLEEITFEVQIRKL